MNRHRLTINKDFSLPAARPDAEQTLHRFGSARADQPGNPQNFAAPQREGDVIDALNVAIHRMPGRQVLHPQDFIAAAVGFARVEGGKLAADHHGDNVIFAHAVSVAGADMLPIADHADGVGDGFDFIELVGNVNAGNTVILQIANNIQQNCRLLFR